MRDELFMLRCAVLLAYFSAMRWWYSIALRHQFALDPMSDTFRDVFLTHAYYQHREREVLRQFNSHCDRRPRSA